MKKLFVGLLAIGSMALVGCSQDEEQLQFGGATFEDFTGEIVSEQTRTSMGADGSVLWSEGDLISLFKKSGYHQNYVVKSYGSASTTFEWVDASTSLGFKPTMNYAAYPYNVNNKINGTTLTLDLSSLAAQTYTANTFENAKAVMVAKSATTNLAFTNAFSLANVKLTADCGAKPAPDETIYVRSIKIESATLPLAGNATVDMSQDKPAAVFAAEGAKSITLTCAEPIQLSAAATNFYILMPAVTFPAEDLTITIQADIAEEAKECVIEVDEEIAFLRSQVTTLNKEITLDAWTGSTEITTVTVDNAAKATEELAKDDVVAVAVKEAAGEINIPAKSTEAAAVPHTIDLSEATLSAAVTINVAEATTGKATVTELTVVVPNEATAENLVINAPETTVTIKGEDGTVFDTIEATTAENTLIVGKGVTITKLVLNKGNVVLEEGAVIGAIHVKDVANLKTAVKVGGTIVLEDNIDMNSEILVLGKNTVLDGNGKTLTSKAGRAINVSGAEDVTIKNLTITCTGERAINLIQNAKKVTIEGVTATAANYTVNVASSAPAAKVVINNSTLNGLCVVNVSSEGADVTVDGSTINCLDKNQTVGEAYAALSLNMESIGGKIIATNTTINVEAGSDSHKGRNSAEDGVVTIDGSTEGVVVMVAVIKSNPSDVYYYTNASLAEAVEFAKNGDVITLIRDIEITETITIERDVTINLNGNKLTANVNKGRAFDIVADDVEFTLNATDSQIEFGNGTYGIIQFKDDATGNKVVVNGGTFEGTTDAGAFVRYRTGKKNTLVLNDVNYKDNCAVQGKNANNPFVISTNGAPADNENSITINGGNYDAACFIATDSKDFSMKGATIKATGLALELKNGTIENSTITLDPGAYVYSIDGAGLVASNSGEVTIKGSTINVSGNYYGIAVAPTGGLVNVKDCKITGTTTKYFVYDQYEGKSGCIKEGDTVVEEKY